MCLTATFEGLQRGAALHNLVCNVCIYVHNLICMCKNEPPPRKPLRKPFSWVRVEQPHAVRRTRHVTKSTHLWPKRKPARHQAKGQSSDKKYAVRRNLKKRWTMKGSVPTLGVRQNKSRDTKRFNPPGPCGLSCLIHLSSISSFRKKVYLFYSSPQDLPPSSFGIN